MNIQPGNPSYAETLARVAALLDAEHAEHQQIFTLSQDSARLWLNDFVTRAAKKLGIALSEITAAVADLLQIARNAGQAFKSSYSEHYNRARRILPD